jgi:ethanolamine utilization protein EutN
MQLGKVEGHATATIKHRSLAGWRLLVVQPLAGNGRPDGEPLLALDNLGARVDDVVLLTSDGKGARELVQAENSPARWFVAGIVEGMG